MPDKSKHDEPKRDPTKAGQGGSDLPLESDVAAEQALWELLGDIEQQEPSPALRKGFYQRLETAAQPGLFERLRATLGFSGNGGWLTATACLLLGIATGQLLAGTNSEDQRLAVLEQNVAALNRTLVLDRLENDSAGKRLQGVLDAAYLADDTEVANALLERATEESVPSVRAAAIDVLGRQLGAPFVGNRIMASILEADSPIVQLALIDLILRNGTPEQLRELSELAEAGELYPDLARHVLTSLKRDVA